MAYVYKHTRLDTNEVFYIGIGSDSEGKYKRAYNKQFRNNHWKNIVNKTEYTVEIVIDNISWEEACAKEIELIKLYGRRDLNEGTLCNLTDGGEGIVGLVFTEEHKRNIAKGGIGNKNMIGKHLSESQKQKLRDRNLNRKHTPETKYKISQAMKGKRSPEFAQKIKESWIKRRQKSIGL
jgi:hypothetical protein